MPAWIPVNVPIIRYRHLDCIIERSPILLGQPLPQHVVLLLQRLQMWSDCMQRRPLREIDQITAIIVLVGMAQISRRWLGRCLFALWCGLLLADNLVVILL